VIFSLLKISFIYSYYFLHIFTSIGSWTTWIDAKQYCENNHSSLFVLENVNKCISFITNQGTGSDQKVWVGLKLVGDGNNKKLEWIDGKSGDDQGIKIESKKSCYYFQTTGHCKMQKFKDKTFNIADCFKAEHCDSKHSFICNSSKIFISSSTPSSSNAGKKK
jgi:hypothetical protein